VFYAILDGKGRDVAQTVKAIRSGLINTGKIELLSDIDPLAVITYSPEKIEIWISADQPEAETFGLNQLDFCVNKFLQIISTITRCGN
jgi:hypothetical protein